jgi:hypothetical protein
MEVWSGLRGELLGGNNGEINDLMVGEIERDFWNRKLSKTELRWWDSRERRRVALVAIIERWNH